MNLLGRLKGKGKLETIENYSILFVFLGAMTLSAGIGLNIISTKGASPIIAMIGAVVTFLSTISLIATWVMRELEKEAPA